MTCAVSLDLVQIMLGTFKSMLVKCCRDVKQVLARPLAGGREREGGRKEKRGSGKGGNSREFGIHNF